MFKGYEVLIDDCNECVGFKFLDSDLIGFLIWVIVGKKVFEGIVEVKIKVSGDMIEVYVDNLIEILEILIKK